MTSRLVNLGDQVQIGQHLFDIIDFESIVADLLMVGAGLRVGEVAALQLANIEEPSAPDSLARLTVRGKGGKERLVPVGRPAMELVEEEHLLDAGAARIAPEEEEGDLRILR